MKSTPEILRHKGILTNWRDYPEGSVERAKALGIDVWQVSERVETTLERWEVEVRVLQREKPWKVLGLRDANEFVKAITGKSIKEIDEEIAVKCVIAKANPIPPAYAPRNPNGVNQHQKDGRTDTNGIKPVQGNTTDYTLRRLARDCPEMLDAIKCGELSVNAAAIQAGIRKKPTPEDACLRAFRKCSDLTEMLRRLQEYYEVAMRHKESTDGRRLD